MNSKLPAIYVFVYANMISPVTLNSTDFRMGLFETVSVLSNVLITDSSLWTVNNVFPKILCLLNCVQDSNCSSVFYNDLTDVCIGHSQVYTASDRATASHGSEYFTKKKPAGAVVEVFYTYRHDRMTWDDARGECQKDNGDLAAFDTPDQFLAFKDYIEDYKATSSVSNSVWVGVRQNTEDFLFYWTRGNVIGSTVTWGSGYPKNASKECGYISPFTEYVMMNFMCTPTLSFVCETPIA